jgi:methyl-accepting chemotaxis protein
MDLLSNLRLRTKLTMLLGLSGLAVIASIALAASQLRQSMLADRVDKLRAVTEMVLGVAQSLEKQVVAGQLTHQAAIDRIIIDVQLMHFDNGMGYISFQTRDGLVIAHGSVPSRNGKPAEGRDAAGRSINTLGWEALATADSGVVYYMTTNPPLNVPTAKVAYVARFDPWQAETFAAADTGDLDMAFRETLLRLGAAGGAVLLITIVAGWLVNRDICVSLGGLKAAMEQLAAGALTIAIPGTNRRDEVGGMAGAVLVFQQHMEKSARLEGEKELQRQRSDDEKRTALVAMAEKIETETGVALQQIGQRTTALAKTASGLADSATRTGTIAQDASLAAGQALATAQTVASAAEQLAASIHEIGGQVNRSSAVVGQAVVASDETRAAIEALNGQVAKIGSVADIIREIAARTNLLALNATIEAARAGDAGKGFAVVASEVKQLANQTARSTEEITNRISEVRSATGISVAAVARIEQTIGAINEIATSISAAVEEQAAATAEIARNVAETASAANVMTARTSEVSAEAVRTGEQAAEVHQDTAGLAAAVDDLRRSVIKVVRTSTSEVNRRAIERFEVDLPCRISASGGGAAAARITDFSAGGACVRDGPAMRTGERGTLDVDGVGFPLPFQVRRMEAGALHVAFELSDAVAARFEPIPERLSRRRAA